jgi:hypothetical protein
MRQLQQQMIQCTVRTAMPLLLPPPLRLLLLLLLK